MKPRLIMRRVMCAISLCVLCGVASGQDWRRYAHDGALTGRCAIAGDIGSPQVRWSFSVAGAEQLILFSPDAGEHEQTFSPQSQPSSVAELPSLAGPMRLDVTGNGTLHAVTESYHERWAKILPDTPGYQRVAWSHTWTDQAVCRLELFAYDQGLDQPRRVWQSIPPEGTIFNPLNIVVDIDGDGWMEIASAGYGDGVRVIDPRTGRKLWSCAAPAPTVPKVSAANIDGAGGDEIIYSAGNQLIVVTGDDQSGRLLWSWQASGSLSMPAIADVDDDGKAKIIIQDSLGVIHCIDGP